MSSTFWLAVYPGLSTDMLDYVADELEQYFGIGFSENNSAGESATRSSLSLSLDCSGKTMIHFDDRCENVT